ncbi:MAG: hypothetical protein OEZ34_12490, partial [Spirochaetia bacterium]|nr:hypothetical protein [Spirochaetia bacterium]
MDFLKPYLLLIFFFLFLISCRTKTIQRVPWEDKPVPDLITEHFEVYSEPSLKLEDYREQIMDAERIWKSFQKDFFPGAGNQKKIRLIIYGNQKSYSRYRRVPIDSLADFERREKRINISVDAPVTVWKHELSHAMLETARPGSPFWLHEGLALFLQAQHFQYPVSCTNLQKAAMPYSLSLYIEEVRDDNNPIPGEFRPRSRRPTPESQSTLAGYFVFYLWDQKKLSKFLHPYQNSKKRATEFLAGGKKKET